MTTSRVLLIACLLLLFGASACEQAEVEEDPDVTTSYFPTLEEGHPAYGQLDLIRRVAGWAAEGDPVGSELIILRGGRPIFHGNWGERDRERSLPWRKLTICRMRSLTHPILATAILMLRDAGKLQLQDPVGKYLPEFRSPAAARITIAEVLSHTAGISNARTADQLKDYGDLCSFVDDFASREASILRDRSPRFTENGYNILACLITRLSGVPVERFLQQRIFDPLGMQDTHCDFRGVEKWGERLASTYSRSPSGLGFRRITDNQSPPSVPYFHADRGVLSTVKDYALFVRFWMNGGKRADKALLSPKSVAFGLRTPEGIAVLPGAYTYAWELFGQPTLDPNVPAPFGQFGADESVALASPQKDLVFVYVTQSRGGETARAFAEAVAEFFDSKVR